MTRKTIVLIAFFSFFACCHAQTDMTEQIVMDINELITTGQYDKADSILRNNNDILDENYKDLLSSVINIIKYSQKIKIDIHSTTKSIKNVINDFSKDKEYVKNNPQLIAYFNIYISFLGEISDSYYLEVYKIFKEIFPSPNKEYAQEYTYVLENTLTYAFPDKRYTEAINIIEELVSLYENKRYQLSREIYTFYRLLAISYVNVGNDQKASVFFDKALAELQFSKNTNNYIQIASESFECAFRLSQFSKCKELGKAIIKHYETNDNNNLKLANFYIKLADAELATFNLNEGIRLYEKGLALILPSALYDDENKKGFIAYLYKLYNTSGVKNENRLYKNYKDKYNIGEVGKVEVEILNEQYADSLLKIAKKHFSENNNPDLKSYVRSIRLLSEYYSSTYREKYGIQLIEEAIKRLEENGSKIQDYAILYSALGSIHQISLHNNQKAKEYYKKAQQIYNQNGTYTPDYIDILCGLSEAYIYSNELIQAKIYLDEACRLSQSMESFKNDKSRYYNLLRCCSNLYKCLDQEEMALYYNSAIIDDISKDSKQSVNPVFPD